MPDGVSLFTVGDRFEVRQVITPEQMLAFRALSGDDNPMHLDDTFAAAHGSPVASLMAICSEQCCRV